MQLTNGKAIELVFPDLYALVAAPPSGPGMIDIPNEALTAIIDLLVYGGILTLPEDRAKRHGENVQWLQAQWEIVRLCIASPPLILRGPVPEGALTPRDIPPRDLAAIMQWFHNGGSDGAPAAEDTESRSGASPDSVGAAVAQAAE